MRHILYLVVILILTLIGLVSKAEENSIKAMIKVSALKNELDPNLLTALCYKESKFKYLYNAEDGGSPSFGPCQIKHIAARQVGFTRPYMTTQETIDIAAKYLKYNLKRCGSLKKALAAYNTGRCMVPSKTGYVYDVLRHLNQLEQGKPLK